MAIRCSRGPDPVRHAVRQPNPDADPHGGCVHYVEYSRLDPQPQWQFHAEYELHLVVSSSGRVFVGDHIGSFEPGHLVLMGPRLPHQWCSTNARPTAGALRDMELRFPEASLRQAAESIPELAEALPLLDRASQGIEFLGVSERAREHLLRIKASQGLRRFAQFSALLDELALCANYRMLSSTQLRGSIGARDALRLSAIVSRIAEEPRHAPPACACAEEFEMTESRFSRFFRSATGRTYTDFVHRVRIQLACQLLGEGEAEILDVCREVGFTNISTFKRRFFELKGITSTEFRRQSHPLATSTRRSTSCPD